MDPYPFGSDICVNRLWERIFVTDVLSVFPHRCYVVLQRGLGLDSNTLIQIRFRFLIQNNKDLDPAAHLNAEITSLSLVDAILQLSCTV